MVDEPRKHVGLQSFRNCFEINCHFSYSWRGPKGLRPAPLWLVGWLVHRSYGLRRRKLPVLLKFVDDGLE